MFKKKKSSEEEMVSEILDMSYKPKYIERNISFLTLYLLTSANYARDIVSALYIPKMFSSIVVNKVSFTAISLHLTTTLDHATQTVVIGNYPLLVMLLIVVYNCYSHYRVSKERRDERIEAKKALEVKDEESTN